MSPEIITALAGGITAVAGAIVWGIRLLFKRLAFILSELKPNGGYSIKDQVTRLEAHYKKLDHKVDKLYELIIDKLGK